MPSFEFECEYAKSARSACKQCKEKIEKGALRLGLKVLAAAGEDADTAARQLSHAAESTRWHHADCFPQVRGAAWFRKNLPEDADGCTGFAGLEAEAQERVRALFATCRGGAAGENLTPSKTPAPGGKRKAAAAPGGEPAAKQACAEPAGVLTEEQLKAIATAREEFGKKSVALLGALLAKNGLPKSGRKEELLERAAECRALGVPPVCSTCSKAKLKWSRMTGAFSCPGFFDDEDKRFKRCKGPADGADLSRTAWQEITA